jgi:hypothetical protein
MPAEQLNRDRWRRYWDKHSGSYDKQMGFFDLWGFIIGHKPLTCEFAMR